MAGLVLSGRLEVDFITKLDSKNDSNYPIYNIYQQLEVIIKYNKEVFYEKNPELKPNTQEVKCTEVKVNKGLRIETPIDYGMIATIKNF